MNSKRFEVRRSPMHGRGLFALIPFRAGERIIRYTGRIIPTAEADLLYQIGPNDTIAPSTYLFIIDADRVIDAQQGGGVARLINHSCNPNCISVTDDHPRHPSVWIHALRDIEPQEELSYIYDLVLEQRHTRKMRELYPCRCGAPNCRGTILGDKSKPARKWVDVLPNGGIRV